MNARYCPCSGVHGGESRWALVIVVEVYLRFLRRGLYTMNIRYRVTLSEKERTQLQELLGKGRSMVREVKRAQILLAAAEGTAEEEIVKAVHTSVATIYRTKRS